jgi:hypothetical protein
VAIGWLIPYIVGHYRLEVANDVFNVMGYVLSCHPAMSHSVCSMTSCCRDAWYCSGALRVVNRAGAVLQTQCSCMFTCLAVIKCTACSHVLQTHDGSDVMRIENMCTWETREPRCIGMTARFFFIYSRLTTH